MEMRAQEGGKTQSSYLGSVCIVANACLPCSNYVPGNDVKNIMKIKEALYTNMNAIGIGQEVASNKNR